MTTSIPSDMKASLSVDQQLLLHRGAAESLAQSHSVQEGCEGLIRMLCLVCGPLISAGAVWLVQDSQERRSFSECIVWPPDFAPDLGAHLLDRIATAGNPEWASHAPQETNRLYVLPVRNWLGAVGILALSVCCAGSFDQPFAQIIETLSWQLGIFIEHLQFTNLSEQLAMAQHREEESRMALDRERDVNDMKSRFISLVSHEFRTPLSIIQSSSELLERYYDRLTDDKRRRYFEQIRTSTMNMADMLQDILVLGRYDSGQTRFDPHPIDLTQYCRQCVEQIQQAAGPKYQLTFDHHGVNMDARMDDKLLWQIINNLLSNAMKYSMQANPLVELTLELESDHALLRIVDHGIGIPPEDQVRLFQPFHRGSNVGAVPGTGLGLSIVHRAVQEHHGEVSFSSIIGEGTTFTVVLPLR